MSAGHTPAPHESIATGSKTVYFSGQVGLLADGTPAGETLREQFAQAGRNLDAVVEFSASTLVGVAALYEPASGDRERIPVSCPYAPDTPLCVGRHKGRSPRRERVAHRVRRPSLHPGKLVVTGDETDPVVARVLEILDRRGGARS